MEGDKHSENIRGAWIRVTSPPQMVSAYYPVLQDNKRAHPPVSIKTNSHAAGRHLFGRHAQNDLYTFSWRNLRFLYSFFPDSVIAWNNLGPETRKIETLSGFKKKLLSMILTTLNSYISPD